MPGQSTTSETASLYLDALIRQDIIARAPKPELAEKMRALPTRQLIYYCIATHLASTLDHARKNSPHYAKALEQKLGGKALDALLVELEKVTERCLLGDKKSYALIEMQLDNILTSLPFTWPEELSESPESFLAVDQSAVQSATLQDDDEQPENKFRRIFSTVHDREAGIAFFTEGMRYILNSAPDAAKEPEKVAIILSAEEQGQESMVEHFAEAMKRLGVNIMAPSNPLDEPATLAELAAFGPSGIISTPRQIISLLRADWGASPEAKEQVERVKAGIKNILLSGDRPSLVLIGILKNELKAEVFLHYDMIETGLGTAVECSHKRGAHYRESDFFIEIITPDGVSHPCPQSSRSTIYIDPDDLEDGCIYGPSPWGEVTITTLNRQALPLIRYRTGDSGRIIVDKCPCGSVLWRLDVRGGLDDHITLPSGPDQHTLEPPCIEYFAFQDSLYKIPWVKDYQVNVHTDAKGKTRDIGVIVLLGDLAPESDQKAGEAIHQALAHMEARAKGHGVKIHIRPVRDRKQFCALFAYSPKRSFPHSEEPIDLALYQS